MPLQKQNISVSFSGGLQQKTDAFQLQPNNMLLLENARFIKSGQVNKRTGFKSLTNQVVDGTNINSAVAINTFNDELLLFDGNSVFSYLQGAAAWVNRGTAISVINKNDEVIRTISAAQENADGVYSNGINTYVWQDSRGGIRYSVKDSVTGTFAVQDKFIFGNFDQTIIRPKTIVDGYGKINIYYTDGGTTLLTNQIDPTKPSVLSPTSIVVEDGYSGSIVYDVTTLNGTPIIAYNYVGTNAVHLILPNRTVNVQTLLPAASLVCINVIVDSKDNIWVSYATTIKSGIFHTYTVYSSCYDSLGNTIMAPKVVNGPINENIYTIAAVEISAGAIYVVYEVLDVPDHHFNVALVQNTGQINQLYTQLGLGLASKCFSYNGNQYINVASQSQLQSTYFTYCLNRRAVIGKINPLVGGGYRSNNMLAECSPTAATGSFLFACGKAGRFQVNNNVSFSLIGVSSETINFAHNNSFNAGTFNNNFLFVGGFLQSYDGVNCSEQNFHFFPEGVQGTAFNISGSGGLSIGIYQYQVTYEWTDNYGQTNYSAPSLPINVVVLDANDSAQITVPTLRVTAKENTRTPVTINIYRTQVNEPVFYKVGSVVNNTTVNTLVFVDTQSDLQIGSNMPLYTSSQVANSAPPSCSLITYFQNRVMLSGLEDPNVIWFSQNVFDFSQFNSIAPSFSNLLTIGVDAWHGDITALGWMDEKLLIFKDQTIYTMGGDGPNASGGGNEFPSPSSILSTVGSTNQNSLVVTYNGVFFKSSKGVYMIDRGLNPTYIGAPVEDFNNLTVTSSDLLADTDEVVFTTAEGTILVYNYYFNTWSVWTDLPAIDSCIWQDALVLARTDGTVMVQDTTNTNFTDDGKFVSLKIQTPWLTITGMQGYQSVYKCFMLGNFKGPHLMNVEVRTNYNPTAIQTSVINSNIVGNSTWGGLPLWGSGGPWGGEFVPYQFQVNFNAYVVRNQAIQLTFFDSPTSPYTEGYTLSSLTFEIGAAPDGMRLPKSNKVG